MRVVLSGIVTDLRGTFGNAVATRNKQGVIFRQRITPLNTFTPIRQLTKTRFADIANAWTFAADSVKLAYKSKALTYTFVDSLGVSYTPSAYQLFQFINMNIYPEVSGFITEPKDSSPLAGCNVTFDYFNIAPGTCNITAAEFGNANEFIKVYCSAFFPGSTQRSSYKTLIAVYFDNATSLPFDLLPYMTALYPNPPQVGQFVVLECLKVDKTTGLISSLQTNSITFQ